MFRLVSMCGVAALLALPSPALAQQVEAPPDDTPLFGALVGGLIGGVVGAAVSRHAPHGAGLGPAASGMHPPGGKGEGAHKGAPAGAPIRKKPGK